MSNRDTTPLVISIEDFTDARSIRFLKKSTCKTVTYHVTGVLSLGFVYLIFYWYALYQYLYDQEPDFHKATTVCIETLDNVVLLIPVHEESFCLDPFTPGQTRQHRFINFIQRKYYYSPPDRRFFPLETVFGNRFVLNKPCKVEEKYSQGLNLQDVETVRKTFGINKLQFPEPSLIEMIVVGLLDPMCVGLLIISFLCVLCDKYMLAILLFLYVLFMILFYTLETRGKIKKIKEMSDLNQKVRVFRRSQAPGNHLFLLICGRSMAIFQDFRLFRD